MDDVYRIGSADGKGKTHVVYFWDGAWEGLCPSTRGSRRKSFQLSDSGIVECRMCLKMVNATGRKVEGMLVDSPVVHVVVVLDGEGMPTVAGTFPSYYKADLFRDELKARFAELNVAPLVWVCPVEEASAESLVHEVVQS